MRRKSSRFSSREIKESRFSLQRIRWKTPYNLDSFVEPLNEDAVAAEHKSLINIVEEFERPPIFSKTEGKLGSFVQESEREGGAATNFKELANFR